MKIAILGTRGIPNQYGGFEQFAERLAVGLVALGNHVTVYSPKNHSYKEASWKGVEIIFKNDPSNFLKTPGQFIYDLNCILDSRKREFDIIYQLGYTSSSVWFRLHSKKQVLVTNMDGIEWKRAKYNSIIKRFLKYAENIAVKNSHHIIADSNEIKSYIDKKYNLNSCFIPYGADIFNNPDKKILGAFNVKAFEYYLVISRFQPDNNIETIIKGYILSGCSHPLLIIGNNKNRYGKYLDKKYGNKVKFLGSIYEKPILNNLRHFSRLYFHGHSSGGTNPSLLEAMGCNSLICSHDNAFNKEAVGNNGYFFLSKNDVSKIIKSNPDKPGHQLWFENNLKTLNKKYNWDTIIKTYYSFFQGIINQGH